MPAYPVFLPLPVLEYDYTSDVAGQGLSDREALTLHSEIKALQDRLGLSYKDAAHRLYMSEVEKLRMEKHAARAMR